MLNTDTTRMKALAADGDRPTAVELDTKNILDTVRATGDTMVKSLAGVIDLLEESPLKTTFLKTKDDINKALASLPATDQIPAAMASNTVLRDLLFIFIQAQDLIKGLGNQISDSRKALASATSAMPAQIETAVKAKVDGMVAAGDLVLKADVATQVQKALASADEARTTVATRIDTRKKALAGAKLPIPSDKILSLEDAAYAAAETEAKDRITKLSKFNLPEGRLKALAYDVDATAFNAVLETLSDRGAGGRGNLFQNTERTDAKGATTPPGVLAFC